MDRFLPSDALLEYTLANKGQWRLNSVLAPAETSDVWNITWEKPDKFYSGLHFAEISLVKNMRPAAIWWCSEMNLHSKRSHQRWHHHLHDQGTIALLEGSGRQLWSIYTFEMSYSMSDIIWRSKALLLPARFRRGRHGIGVGTHNRAGRINGHNARIRVELNATGIRTLQRVGILSRKKDN